MANTAAVYARIDTNLKESAEDILAQLGITPSSAIQMLYRQIVLTPTAVGGMSRTELDTELQKGVASLQNGKSFSADEVDAALYQEFGI